MPSELGPVVCWIKMNKDVECCNDLVMQAGHFIEVYPEHEEEESRRSSKAENSIEIIGRLRG